MTPQAAAAPVASPVDPRDAIKTHVSELSPAERLARHDQAARADNAKIPDAPVVITEAIPLTFENLCGVVLDVVKDFARLRYTPITIQAEHVVEKALQRFPDGVTLVGAVETEVDTEVGDPLRLGLVKGSNDLGHPPADDPADDPAEDNPGAMLEPDDEKPTRDKSPKELADEPSRQAPAKPAAKTAKTKKAPTRKPAGPAPKSKP